tara:strand:+ start:984 stop:1343 length:360 start_codon:yes stop_codon:yes gene_type:complete
MITTSIIWNITDLRRDDSDGFVFEIKYSITGISTETVGSASTTHSHVVTGGYLVPDHTRTGNEVGFSSLTEAQIVNWVKAGLGTTETIGWENAISGHLDGMRQDSLIKSDATSSGLPWG